MFNITTESTLVSDCSSYLMTHQPLYFFFFFFFFISQTTGVGGGGGKRHIRRMKEKVNDRVEKKNVLRCSLPPLGASTVGPNQHPITGCINLGPLVPSVICLY